MGDYKQLAVWQKSHQFVLGVYKASAAFPKDELYGVSSQLNVLLYQSLLILLKALDAEAMVS